jgi:hypothetical protein
MMFEDLKKSETARDTAPHGSKRTKIDSVTHRLYSTHDDKMRKAKLAAE